MLAIAPDGGRVAIAPGWLYITDTTFDNGGVRGYDATSGERERVLPLRKDVAVETLAFSPDGKQLIADVVESAPADRWTLFFQPGRSTLLHEVIVWDVATGAVVWKTERFAPGIAALTYSPDGTLLAVCGMDNRLRIWRAADGRPLHEFPAVRDEFPAVAFSPNGKLVAAGGAESISLWDVATRQLVLTLPHGAGALEFTSDGRRLVASGRTGVRVYDAGPP